MDLVTRSAEETERLGERIGRIAEPGDVLALWGDLGAGKTVLTRGVAAGLGIPGSEITSPTFVLLHEHHGGRLPLFHLDLYRMRGEADLTSVGWEECLESGGVTVIEWPERTGAGLPEDRIDVKITHAGDQERVLRLEAAGPRARARVARLKSDAPRA